MSLVKPTHPLVAAYVQQLAAHPLRTKCATLGLLQFLQEVVGSHLARVPPKRVPKDAPFYKFALSEARMDLKALKMAIYGFFISAPLGHWLSGQMAKAFAGKTPSTKLKIAQILASNLVVSPISVSGIMGVDDASSQVYLACMAIINGAKSLDDIIRTWQGGFMNVIRVTWMSSPLAMVFAQKYLPPQLWFPFFSLVQFSLGTYFNIKVKKIRLAAEAKAKKEQQEKRD
ncbi:hypothetical protein NLI96_g1346 [Meripilus lineatus]|uniref:Uncharacterized protein n=1 Tax=Meripilus lineatus TaxID=2056292 RepID=A0AAD5VC74_9APHY|nr:hypothetical protein NLI96_g1346 [Physisporinus lineatus]